MTNIGNYAFYQHLSNHENPLTVQIGDSVERIGAYAFHNQKKLGEITLPSGLKDIGEHAFYNCSMVTVTNENLPETLEAIGNSAFEGAALFMVAGDTMTLPESVTTVGSRAFYGSGITGLEILSSDTILDANAFTNCTNLSTVTVPADLQYNTNYEVTHVGAKNNYGSFYRCTGIKTLHYTKGKTGVMPDFIYSGYDPNDTKRDNDYRANLSFSAGDSDGSGLETIIIDEGVTNIGDYAFYQGSSSHQNPLVVQIGDGIERIGAHAFHNQKKLGEITLPSGLKDIGEYAFYNCNALSISTDHPVEKLESIGAYAFSGCNELKAFYLPDQATAFGTNAFGYARNTLTLFGRKDSEAQTFAEENGFQYRMVYEPAIVSDNGETEIDKGESLTVTAEMYTKYCRSVIPDRWNVIGNVSETTIFTTDEFLSHGTLSVSENETSSRITLEAEFSDGDETYRGQLELTIKNYSTVVHLDPNGGEVETEYIEVSWNTPFGKLPEAFRNGGFAFAGWYTSENGGNLVTEETMNEENTEITLFAHWMYKMTAGLIDIRLPDGIKAIEEGAFEGTPVEVVYVPDECESIDTGAFRDCSRLLQIRIPDGCTIDDEAFDGCTDILIFGTSESLADMYCRNHDNCTFIEE